MKELVFKVPESEVNQTRDLLNRAQISYQIISEQLDEEKNFCEWLNLSDGQVTAEWDSLPANG